MKNNHNSKTQMKPFLITTALVSSLFLGAEVARSLAPTQDNLTIDQNLNANGDAPMDGIDYPSSLANTLTQSPKEGDEPDFIDSLTLVDESLQQVLALLEKWTQKILILSNNLPKVTFNINIPMPLSQNEAISVLKSALLANGIAVTPIDDKKLNVLPANRAKNSAPAIVKREDLPQMPGSKEICCCLYRVNNLTAREAARIITPWVTPLNSSVVTLDKANSLFITDSLCNLQQLHRIFNSIDKVGDVQESILFFTPKNASAESLKKNFEDLQKGALKCYLLGNTSFAADKSTNLFVAITPKGNERLINEFFERLDINVDSLIQHHVFRIQHGSCKEMTDLVKKLMQQQKQANNSSINNATDSFSKQLSIECDERLNAIVAYGTPSDIRQIQQLVDQLDVVLPQVRIEVVIAEVRLVKGQASGLETFGYTGNARTSEHALSGISIPSFPGHVNPLTINKLTFPGFSIDTVLNTAKSNENVAILSSPTLLTTHAREATLKITETRPYISSIQSKTDGGSGAADVSNSTVEKVDAGIELVVKPLLGLNGIIQLEIDQKVDNFTENSTKMPGSGVSLPHISRRSIKSFVSIPSGEMLVLAGLKQKEATDSKRKIFFFGDLPIIGDKLFSSNVKHEEVKELIIFIRPYLLKDEESFKANSEMYASNLEDATRTEVEAYKDNSKFSEHSIFKDPKIKRKQKDNTQPRFPQNRHARTTKRATLRRVPRVEKTVRRRPAREFNYRTLHRESVSRKSTSRRHSHRTLQPAEALQPSENE